MKKPAFNGLIWGANSSTAPNSNQLMPDLKSRRSALPPRGESPAWRQASMRRQGFLNKLSKLSKGCVNYAWNLIETVLLTWRKGQADLQADLFVQKPAPVATMARKEYQTKSQ